MQNICHLIPKAELHVHIEGTLEPEFMIKIAERNKIELECNDIEKIKEQYNFNNLKQFLDLYYKGSSVLLTQEDFSDLVYEYFKKAIGQGVIYSEIFFDPQAHIHRGVDLKTILIGLLNGLEKSIQNFNIDGNFIMCFLRDLSEEDSLATFEYFLKIKNEKLIDENINKIIGIGLDSNEIGNPPEKFKNVFQKAKENGFKICVHCHDEDYLINIKTSLEILEADRIDHGFDIILDEKLMENCIERKIPFTFCPISTYKVKRTEDLKVYQLNYLLEKGLLVTINSDDPAYFGGYIGDNYLKMVEVFDLDSEKIIKLSKNSFNSSFLPKYKKLEYLTIVEKFLEKNK